jgi:hypothetical protein
MECIKSQLTLSDPERTIVQYKALNKNKIEEEEEEKKNKMEEEQNIRKEMEK